MLNRTSETSPQRFLGITGMFYMLDTFGFPPIMFFKEMQKLGARPAMDSFVFDAISSGWGFDKAIASVREIIAEEFGPHEAQRVIPAFEKYCKVQIARGVLVGWEQTRLGIAEKPEKR